MIGTTPSIDRRRGDRRNQSFASHGSVVRSAIAGHPLLQDVGKAKMAKATVRKLDRDDALRMQGRILTRMFKLLEWSHKEAAWQLEADEAEVGKWCTGTRPAPWWRILAHPLLHRPLLIAQGAVTVGVEIETRISTPEAVLRICGSVLHDPEVSS